MSWRWVDRETAASSSIKWKSYEYKLDFSLVEHSVYGAETLGIFKLSMEYAFYCDYNFLCSASGLLTVTRRDNTIKLCKCTSTFHFEQTEFVDCEFRKLQIDGINAWTDTTTHTSSMSDACSYHTLVSRWLLWIEPLLRDINLDKSCCNAAY